MPASPEFFVLEFSGRAETPEGRWKMNGPSTGSAQKVADAPSLGGAREKADALNEQADKIAGEIARSVRKKLPPGFRVEADISFSEGSIEWAGMLTVIGVMANVGGSISLLEYLVRVAKISIQRVLRRHLGADAEFLDNEASALEAPRGVSEERVPTSPAKTSPPEGVSIPIHLVNTGLLVIVLVLLVVQLALGR